MAKPETNIGSLISQCGRLFLSNRGALLDCFEPKYPNIFIADSVKQKVNDMLSEHEVKSSDWVVKAYRNRPEIRITQVVYDGLYRGDGFYASHTKEELTEPEIPPKELKVEEWVVSRVIGTTQMQVDLREYITGDDETTRRVEFFMGIGSFAGGEPGIFKVNMQKAIAKALDIHVSV